MIEQARGKFIEHVGIETYPNPRRRWPESAKEVAGGEEQKFENGFCRFASIRVLIPFVIAWGLFCELVGIEMEVGEWSERENELHLIRSKTRAWGEVLRSNSNNGT